MLGRRSKPAIEGEGFPPSRRVFRVKAGANSEVKVHRTGGDPGPSCPLPLRTPKINPQILRKSQRNANVVHAPRPTIPIVGFLPARACRSSAAASGKDASLFVGVQYASTATVLV